MSDNADRVERTLELVLYAPIGAALSLRESAPSLVKTFVARGRAEVDRRQEQLQQHVTTARSTGEVALAFGFPKLRLRMERSVEDARRRAQDFLDSNRPSTNGAKVDAPDAPVPAPVPAAEPIRFGPAVQRRHTPEPDVDAPRCEELPIPGYDALSASQVVERLTGLAPSELDAVHAYENAHRQRRTILGKIEQLAG